MHTYKCSHCAKTKPLSNLIIKAWEIKGSQKASTADEKYGICRACNNLMNRLKLNEISKIIHRIKEQFTQ